MSDTISISLEPRTITGKAVKHLRKEGVIPAVIHDHGKPSVNVSGNYAEMLKLYRAAGKHHPVAVTANGKNYVALIKTATFDPRKNQLTHIVFNAVKANQKVEAEIPVRIKYAEGNEASPAERAGLIVLHNLETVEVAAFPKDLPDFVEFDGEKLVEVGDHATVADIIVPNGVEIRTDPTQQIASVFEPSALAAANDAAGGDADEADAETVDSDHESSAKENTQKDEIRPGGKEGKESHDQGTNPEKK